MSKIESISTNSTFLTTSAILYTNNALNQMLGYTETNSVSSVYSVVEYSYDPNGARTNKTETVSTPSTVSTNLTAYTYDEDNRLISVGGAGSPSTPSHTFAYDYRSRRYYRSTPTETNLCVFDGGLSIQEYNAADIGLLDFGLSTTNLQTEFVRGEGMGGGVGGMVYSIKHPAPGSQLPASIICSHANHRGDVIARSDSNGSLTSFALYEAYGTRPYEWGDDPDRQKANTKEEETDLGLLNEGMRYRDLDTGTFTTRDPIGYEDGPNIYCYVHCNPITHFDALGLFQFGSRPLKDGNAPWIPGLSSDPILDLLNLELSHEHGFFEDGSGDNFGFRPNGRFSEDPKGKNYRYGGKHYDDARMRQALKNLKDGKYSLRGKVT